MIKRLRALTPLVLPKADHRRDPEQREFCLSGLRLAISADEAALSSYSITLSARASNENGTAMPSALAAGKFTASSNRTGA